MISYSVAQVEAITGISSHKLRIWERRYSFIKPSRTSTNIRYYTDEDLKMLINVGILTRNGFRISVIDKMSVDEISEKVLDIIDNTDSEIDDEISSLIISTINLDEDLFEKVFRRQLMKKGFLEAVSELIYPFLQKVGILWGVSKIIPSQEHFISNLIRQKIITAIDTLATPQVGAPGLLLFLFQGEMHEIGLLLASFIAKNNGWKVYYLGQNVPTDNVLKTAEVIDIKLMMSIITTPRVEDIASEIKKICSESKVPLILSGRFDNFPEIKSIENLKIVQTPNELNDLLDSSKL